MFLSPEFVSNLRTQLRVIQEQPYKAFLNSKNSWWQYVAKVMPTATEKQVVMWLLQTAQLKGTGLSTDVIARDLTILKQEFTPENVSAAMKMSLNKFKDTDANGMNILAGWVEQIAAQAAYFPQKQIGAAIVNGTAATTANFTYDKQVFFSTAHPYNPSDASVTGTYANIFTGTAGVGGVTALDPSSALYPGAVDVRSTVPFETAFAALQRVFMYIYSLKQANTQDPRFLVPGEILAPTALVPRLNVLLKAKFAAFAAAASGTAGGTTDIEGQLAELGFQGVRRCPELDGDPTAFYVVTEEMMSSQLGGLVWLEREPVAIQTFFPTDNNSELARRNEMEGIARGRMSALYGHPYGIFKCVAT
jgi:phage major head subunit gpT-like protein